jgi:soluble lytic murein transglycosylase-like protein
MTKAQLRQMIQTAAVKYGNPPELVLRQAERESGTRQTDAAGNIIRSSAGALGIMQLMPGTARELGVDPYDVAQNIDGGARYLKQMYTIFKSWPLAFAAYNAGPGNMGKVIRGEKALPGETAAYVQYIMGAPLSLGPPNPSFRLGRGTQSPIPGQPKPARRPSKPTTGN